MDIRWWVGGGEVEPTRKKPSAVDCKAPRPLKERHPHQNTGWSDQNQSSRQVCISPSWSSCWSCWSRAFAEPWENTWAHSAVLEDRRGNWRATQDKCRKGESGSEVERWRVLLSIHQRTNRSCTLNNPQDHRGKGSISSMNLIEAHKRSIEREKKKLGVTDYGLLWISFLRGAVVALIIERLIIH